MSLTEGKCAPCKVGAPLLTAEEIARLSPQVPEWKVVEKDGVSRIRREFTFPDFIKAMEFAVAVGELAEEEQHHPDLHVSWGLTVVETWTHKIRGLHENDFILAAKTDRIYSKEA